MTASFSSGSPEQVAYTSRPPSGLRRPPARSEHADWSVASRGGRPAIDASECPGSRRRVPEPRARRIEQNAVEARLLNGKHPGHVRLHHANGRVRRRVSTVRLEKIDPPSTNIGCDDQSSVVHRRGHRRRLASRRCARVEDALTRRGGSELGDELRRFVLDGEQPFASERRQQRVAAANRQAVHGEASRRSCFDAQRRQAAPPGVARDPERVRTKRQGRRAVVEDFAQASAASNPWRSSHRPTSHSG